MALTLSFLMAGFGAAAEPSGAAGTLGGLNFELPRVRDLPDLRVIRERCRRSDPDEILVCGRRDGDRYRMPRAGAPIGPNEGTSPFELDLGGGVRGSVPIEQINRNDGWVDYRILIRIRVPF